jgi:hypothetical protein
VWTGLFAAGFASVEIVAAEFPSALAIIARRGSGKKPGRALISKLRATPRRVAKRILRGPPAAHPRAASVNPQ